MDSAVVLAPFAQTPVILTFLTPIHLPHPLLQRAMKVQAALALSLVLVAGHSVLGFVPCPSPALR